MSGRKHDGCARCGSTAQEILTSTTTRDAKGKPVSLALCESCRESEIGRGA